MRNDFPIIILGASQRTGSTLVQRLVNTSEDTFIWGEHDGQISAILNTYKSLCDWTINQQGAYEEYELYGINGFIANITPAAERITAAYKAFISELFGSRPNGLPVKRWGFKETRYGAAEIEVLQRIFEKMKIVFVMRDPVSIVRSLACWEADIHNIWHREWTLDALNQWIRSADQVLNRSYENFVIKYEDLLLSPHDVSRNLGEFLGIDDIDIGILEHVAHGVGREGHNKRTTRSLEELDDELRSALVQRDVLRLREAWGYR